MADLRKYLFILLVVACSLVACATGSNLYRVRYPPVMAFTRPM